MSDSKCVTCSVNLQCLAGRLRVRLYCETCRCLELDCDPNIYSGEEQGPMIPCTKEDAHQLHTVLSVCEECRIARKLGYYDRHCKGVRREGFRSVPRL